jgi:hypothetical protein
MTIHTAYEAATDAERAGLGHLANMARSALDVFTLRDELPWHVRSMALSVAVSGARALVNELDPRDDEHEAAKRVADELHRLMNEHYRENAPTSPDAAAL